jgi:hypothetical protein
MKQGAQSVFPTTVRRPLLVAVGLMLAMAIAVLVWRGPALLLDLSALSSMLWCF